MPRIIEKRDRGQNKRCRPPVPPPRRAVSSAEGFDEVCTPGIQPPSSQEDYLLDANAFYGGTSFAHNEDISCRKPDEDATEATPVGEEPRCPQNSPVNNIISDETKAQIERNEDVSHLFSEVRYPSHTPLTLGGSSTMGPGIIMTQKTITRSLARPSGIVETIREGQDTHTLSKCCSADSSLLNNDPRFAVRVETEELSGSESSGSSDDYWLAGEVPVIPRLDIGIQQTSNRSRLDTVDETVEGRDDSQMSEEQEEASNLTAQNAVTFSLENDVHNQCGWIYLSASSEEEYLTLLRGKGKSVDRRVHPNYDYYVGYTRRMLNTSGPGFEPGPSDWQTRPRLRDIPREYHYGWP
jgi:hypothetical protein